MNTNPSADGQRNTTSLSPKIKKVKLGLRPRSLSSRIDPPWRRAQNLNLASIHDQPPPHSSRQDQKVVMRIRTLRHETTPLHSSSRPQRSGFLSHRLRQGTNQYLGHPSTVLLDDQKTFSTAFPTGHSFGALRLRRNPDRGKSWKALPNPNVALNGLPILFTRKLT